MSSTPLDLEAIRAMVRTSKDGTQATDPHAARHVPDLLDEIDRLRTQIEADSDYEALARDERDHRESQLIEQRDHLQAKVDAVRALADRAEQNARRWEHPIPAPEWVGALRQALGEAPKHPADERCYFCATDSEVEAAVEGRPHPTIHMQPPGSSCPNA